MLLTKYRIGYISQKADSGSMSKILSEAILDKNVVRNRMKELWKKFDPDMNARNFLRDLERLQSEKAH